jgi:K+ transporter
MFGSSDALGGACGIAVSMLMAVTTVLAALVALQWGYNPLLVAVVNGFFLVIELIFVTANMAKLVEGGWFPLLMAGVIAFLMLTWRAGWQLLEQQRSKLRQREDEFVEWVLRSPPIRLPGAAAIFTAASTGIPLGLTHHLRHNRVLHERVLLIASITTDVPRVEPQQRIRLVPVGAGITRVIFYFGFMESPDMMAGLQLACLAPELHGIDPQNITYYFRRVMVIPSDKPSAMAKIHLCNNAPERQSPGRIFWRSGRPGGRGRSRSRNIAAVRMDGERRWGFERGLECLPGVSVPPPSGPYVILKPDLSSRSSHPSKMKVTSMVTRYSSILPFFTLAFSSIT